MKENKIKIYILVILVVLIIIVAILNNFAQKKQDKQVYEKSLEEIGKRFYTEYVYKNQYSLIEQGLKENKKLSITVENLLKAYDTPEATEFKKTKIYKQCDLENSFIMYKLRSPISEDNFEIEVHLKC